MTDRFSHDVVHTSRSRAFYDSMLGALRHKRMAW